MHFCKLCQSLWAFQKWSCLQALIQIMILKVLRWRDGDRFSKYIHKYIFWCSFIFFFLQTIKITHIVCCFFPFLYWRTHCSSASRNGSKPQQDDGSVNASLFRNCSEVSNHFIIMLSFRKNEWSKNENEVDKKINPVCTKILGEFWRMKSSAK